LLIFETEKSCFSPFLSGYDADVKKKTRRQPSMSAIHITKENFEAEVLRSDKPVLLDFWAPWCAPCRMVLPVVEEIAAERSDIKVGKINID
jgi:thioredoxin-like negative regulator of GroEL